MKSIRSLLILSVWFLGISLPEIGKAAQNNLVKSQIPKTFAIFSVSYNRLGQEVRGGVCGSAFFISPTRAITAYHVLQPASFKPQAGFERVRVWLVHEGERAIELKPEYLSYQADHDLTRIQLPSLQAVDAKYIFPTTTSAPALSAEVETDGIRANTAGPVLKKIGQDFEVVSVPRLERLRAAGRLLRRTPVYLSAADVKLNGAIEFELSYQPVVGLSGGPVVSGGYVIAMNSFADPGGAPRTWALDLRAAVRARTP